MNQHVIDAVYTNHNESPPDKAILGEALQVKDSDADYLQLNHYYSWYWAMTKAMQPKSIVEIGVRFGYTAIAMIKGAGTVTSYTGYDNECYEPGSNAIAGKAIGKVCGGSVDIHNLDTQVDDVELPVADLYHIDGDHSYEGAWHDIQLAWNANPNAWIIVDDYSFETVAPAVDEFIETVDADLWIIPTKRVAAVIRGRGS